MTERRPAPPGSWFPQCTCRTTPVSSAEGGGARLLGGDSLLEPQREVGGVADHPQQVGRVLLFVLFGPNASDQLRRPDGPADDKGQRSLVTASPAPSFSGDSPVQVGLDQRELASDLDGVEGHEVKLLHLARRADVPLDGRRRALEGDVVADAVQLSLQLPPDDLVDGLHPLPHGFT